MEENAGRDDESQRSYYGANVSKDMWIAKDGRENLAHEGGGGVEWSSAERAVGVDRVFRA